MSNPERVEFDSNGIKLVGRFRPGAGAGAGGFSPGVVICHPHPQFGGSMDNNVVYSIEGHCTRAGLATLCFNFRGVGGSEGEYDEMRGEVTDVISALWYLAGRTDIDSSLLGLSGYSFGGLMAMKAASSLLAKNRGNVNGLTLKGIGLVSPMPGGGPWENDDSLSDLLKSPPCTLVVASTRDQFCPPKTARDLQMQIGPNSRIVMVEGADHFYWEREDEAGQPVADFMTSMLKA